MSLSSVRYRLLLTVLYLALWIPLAIAPFDRADWLLENILVVVFAAFLIGSFKRLPLSGISYTLIFVFLCLHAVGAHYTYAEVPYDAWVRNLAGGSLNEMMGWERNHFDRLVHFSYGLLLAYPIREVFLRVVDARGFWGYFLPLDVTMSTSMIYELVKWAVAETVGGDLGMAYIGTQGDIWDAHKDMALASLGALIAMTVAMAVNMALQRDFAREFRDSLRVKHAEPLGEVRIDRLRPNLSRPAERVVAFYNHRGTAEQYIKEGKYAIKWTRLSCSKFRNNEVRLQFHALAYNLGNFMRTLALPKEVEHWSLTTLREKLVKIGAKVVRHGRYVTFQLAEVAVSKILFQKILALIDDLRRSPVPA